jgi:superfamily I DNA and RNA helicase
MLESSGGIIMQNSETVSAMAVRCACTAIHVRKFLIRNDEMTDQVRRDLQATATLLENVSSELEEFEHTQGDNALAQSVCKSRPRSLDGSLSVRWRPMMIVPPRKSAPDPA